jgi:hypothetical protein
MWTPRRYAKGEGNMSKSKCPHCILRRIEKRTRIEFSTDFKAGFMLGVVLYPDLTKTPSKNPMLGRSGSMSNKPRSRSRGE